MEYYAGIDIGASSTKAIIINDKKEVLGYAVGNSGADFTAAADASGFRRNVIKRYSIAE